MKPLPAPRDEDPKLPFDMIKEPGQAERHFDSTRARYRSMASGWMTATFAGIGFLPTRAAELPLTIGVAIVLIGFAGSLRAFILRALDLKVYHRLLRGCFETAHDRERAHADLRPRTRSRMIQTRQGGRVACRARFFHILRIAAPMAIGAGLLPLLKAAFGGVRRHRRAARAARRGALRRRVSSLGHRHRRRSRP